MQYFEKHTQSVLYGRGVDSKNHTRSQSQRDILLLNFINFIAHLLRILCSSHLIFSFFRRELVEHRGECQAPNLSDDNFSWRIIFMLLHALQTGITSLGFFNQKTPLLLLFLFLVTKIWNRKWPETQFPWHPLTWMQFSRRWKARAVFW